MSYPIPGRDLVFLASKSGVEIILHPLLPLWGLVVARPLRQSQRRMRQCVLLLLPSQPRRLGRVLIPQPFQPQRPEFVLHRLLFMQRRVKLILLLQSRRQSVTAPVLLRMLLVSLCIQEALEQRGLQRDRSTSYHRAKKTPKGDDSRGVPEAARKASMHAKGKREVQATEVLSESTWTASTHAESDPCMTC